MAGAGNKGFEFQRDLFSHISQYLKKSPRPEMGGELSHIYTMFHILFPTQKPRSQAVRSDLANRNTAFGRAMTGFQANGLRLVLLYGR